MRARLIGVTSLTLAALALSAGCSGDDDDSSAGGAGGASAGRGGSSSSGSSAGGSVSHAGVTSGGSLAQGGDFGAGATPSGFAGEAAVAGAPAGGIASELGGAAGMGGEGGGPAVNLTLDPETHDVQSVEGELVRTLYFFGRDVPAAAGVAPVSGCTADCLAAWPVFHIDAAVAGAGLNAADFGEFTRPDGKLQSTFKGWPLYYFASDTAPGQRSGEGIEQLWHVVEQPFYSLVLMRSGSGEQDTGAYLADGAGHTLYRFIGDQAGTPQKDPVSTCTTAGCRKTWPVASPTLVHAVSSIHGDFDTFIRPDTGEVQLSYQGLPLYYFAQDLLPGDRKGVGKPSWMLATP